MYADEVLSKLKKGNQRFVEATEKGIDLAIHIDKQLMSQAQKPSAIILGCSDSRVPAEMIFYQGMGDLFVIRVAGNVVTPSQIGSVEFACQQFGTQLVVVMGHTQCGAVSATVDSLLGDPGSLSPNLASIVDRVIPAVQPIVSQNKNVERERLMQLSGKANVMQSVSDLQTQSIILRELVNNNKLKIVGAEYCIKNGQVEFY